MAVQRLITSSETSRFVIVKKVEIALSLEKNRFRKHVSLDRSDETSAGHTVSKLTKLPPLSRPKRLSVTHRSVDLHPLSSSINTPTISDNGNRLSENKLKLPVISPSAVTGEKNILAEIKESPDDVNSDTEKMVSSFESSEEPSTSLGQSLRRSQLRITHNVRLVWLTSNIIRSESVRHFYQVVDMIKSFTDVETCVDFLQKAINDMVFFIVSTDLGPSTIKRIHDLPQIQSIFLLGKTIPKNKQWIKAWPKIKSFHTNIDLIYEAVRAETEQCRRNSITISDTDANFTHGNSSFMYTKLLKEILLDMAYDDTAKKSFVQFCRQKGRKNRSSVDLKIIDEFEHDHFNSPIWWYTRDCFLYQMVNQAFRLEEIDIIIETGSFIQALQRQVERLHIQPTEKLTFFRGQALPHADFDQLRRMKKGSRLHFNSFLSTSADEKTGLFYADAARQDPKQVGILFRIEVDPVSLTSTRLASLDDESYFLDTEKEVLFTMHTVFRVGEIQLIEERLWQVKLSLISEDDDKELQQLTERVRRATQGSTGWDRLGKLLLKMRNFDKAEEVFEVLIENSTGLNTEEDSHRYHMMGIIKKCKKHYDEALSFYYKALEIYENVADFNQVDLTTIYNDIALVYKETERYFQALEYYQKTLHIQENYTPVNQSDLASTYGNLADVHKSIEQYPEALQYHRKRLEIHKKSYPVNVLGLATSYESIAEIYYITEDYTEALELYKKASTIRKHRLPDMETDSVTSYLNIGQVHDKMGDYPTALAYYEDALKILEKPRSRNSLQLAVTYNNIAHVYKKMKQYMKALEFYRKTRKILDRSSQLEQPDLATTLDNIGQMYEKLEMYEEALFAYRKAIDRARQSLPNNHLELQLYQRHLAKLSKKVDIDF